MFIFLSYILKVSLSLAAFYMFYKLLCSRDTLHRFNRCLLLFILVLSAVVPFMYIDLDVVFTEATVAIEELSLVTTAEPVADSAEAVSTPHSTFWQRIPWEYIPWRTLLVSIYLIGLVVYLIKFIVGLVSIALLIRRSKCREMADGIILVIHTKDYSPFSWMRYIIVSEHDLRENYAMILAHERAHIRLGHSWDLLFTQLCAILQWFNPAAWLLKRELEAIHEYEADSDTLRQGFDARQYQLRLFEAATGVKYSSFTNNFINCSTKKRIIMMMKTQTSPWALLKALYVLPVAFAAVSIFSCTSPKEKKVENKDVAESVQKDTPTSIDETQVVAYATTPRAEEQGEIFMIVEEQPMFPGGMEELMKYLQKEIKYPQEAIDKGIGGKAIVQFVVNTDGSICNDSVVRSVDPILDAEAIRVVRSMPNWTPGKQRGEPVRVRFTMPVAFGMGGNTTSGTPHTYTNTTVKQKTVAKQDDAEDEIVNAPEELAVYPGGMGELMKFLSRNIKYPKEAQDKGIQGRVVLQFVVNKDGSICDSKVVKAVDPQLDAEALRVINAMPNWTPGKQKGEPVRTRFTLPVSFRLQ